MKASLLVLAFLGIGFCPAMAGSISPTDATKHLGEKATVQGLVTKVHRTESGAIVLEIGDKPQGREISAIIFPKSSAGFENVQAYAGETVNITGLLTLHQGKPQIELTTAAQIEVLRQGRVHNAV